MGRGGNGSLAGQERNDSLLGPTKKDRPLRETEERVTYIDGEEMGHTGSLRVTLARVTSIEGKETRTEQRLGHRIFVFI